MTTPGGVQRVDARAAAERGGAHGLQPEAERFLILPPQVHEYMQRKAANAERWLTGMRRLRDRIYGGAPSA
jgi:hypothetical protein